jgi:hypothetical protein
MEKDTLFFLKISGYLKKDKQKEFQQTVRFIMNNLPPECNSSNLAQDITHKNLYHFFLTWASIDAVKRFKASHDYRMLLGSYETLGSYKDTLAGKESNLTLFDGTFSDYNLFNDS